MREKLAYWGAVAVFVILWAAARLWVYGSLGSW